MARRAFFSFHYENDVWRANVVRNSWVTKDSKEAAGFIDAADFEEIRKGGDSAIKNWIDGQLYNTSVTVVLIGSDTSNRSYVQYEVQRSYERGNGMLGIHIHGIKDQSGNTSEKGDHYFGEIGKDSGGNAIYFGSKYKIYDWVTDGGYTNMGSWIEAAAKAAGK